MTSGHHPPPPPPDGVHPGDWHPEDWAGHPDLEVLADLDAGLSDPTTAARLTRHVDGCASCTATLRSLAAVRAELRSLPAPRPPDSVLARLDAMLTGLRTDGSARHMSEHSRTNPPAVASTSIETSIDSSSGSAGTSGGSAPPSSHGAHVADLAMSRERRQERSRRITTLVAASVVVLAAAVGVGTAVLTHSSSKSTLNQATALSPEERSTSPRTQTGGKAGSDDAPTSSDGRGIFSGPMPAYTRFTLDAALALIEQRSSVAAIEAAGIRGPAGAMADRSRRERCAESIPGELGQPTAVRQVTFEGKAAFVFVYNAVKVRKAVVVGLDCGLRRSPTVLYQSPR
jgi:hypothetical protein